MNMSTALSTKSRWSCLFILALSLCAALGNSSRNDELIKAARSGNGSAQLRLADEYFFSRNRTGNPALAVYWYRKAAEQGIGEAQYNLGCCFLHGWGVQSHPIVAVHWFDLAAKNKIQPAILEYSKLLFKGVPGGNSEYGDYPPLIADPQTAVSQLRSLSKTFSPAKLELVKILRTQRNTQKECLELLHSYTAEFPSHPEAAVSYGEILLATGNLSAARRELERGAKFNYPPAWSLLAEILEGSGNSEDLKRSIDLTFKAAQANNPLGLVQLGKHQLLGVRVKHDPVSAFTNFKKASCQNFTLGWRYLGGCYRYGIGTKQDYYKAVKCWERGAAAGNGESAYQLGLLYLHGYGVPADPVTANYWFRQALHQKHPGAMRELGISLVEGRGCKRNYTAGTKLLSEAGKSLSDDVSGFSPQSPLNFR